MTTPISIRLDEASKSLIERAAQKHKMALSSYIRKSALDAAKEEKKAHIRQAADSVAQYIQSSPKAQEFCESWGDGFHNGF